MRKHRIFTIFPLDLLVDPSAPSVVMMFNPPPSSKHLIHCITFQSAPFSSSDIRSLILNGSIVTETLVGSPLLFLMS